MSKQESIVIPIRRESPAAEDDEFVADLAYALWLGSAFHGGSPEEALLTATRMLREKAPADLFLVPKRRHNLQPIVSMRRDSSGVS
jgi:hypothetical protein